MTNDSGQVRARGSLYTPAQDAAAAAANHETKHSLETHAESWMKEHMADMDRSINFVEKLTRRRPYTSTCLNVSCFKATLRVLTASKKRRQCKLQAIEIKYHEFYIIIWD
jgi:hypothetical protein